MVLVPMATNASNFNQSGGEPQDPAEAKSLLQTAATIFIILAPILLGILFFHAWFG